MQATTDIFVNPTAMKMKIAGQFVDDSGGSCRFETGALQMFLFRNIVQSLFESLNLRNQIISGKPRPTYNLFALY